MSATLDDTHDPDRRSWVDAANDGTTDFPIQNLPLGVARTTAGPESGRRMLVTAIGDAVLDLGAAAAAGALHGVAAEIASRDPDLRLNDALARPPAELTELRRQLAGLLDARSTPRPELLRPAAQAMLELPCRTANFTDFYAGIHHAERAGSILGRGGLLPNYRWVPIAYQSRASSLLTSGADVRRPAGQTRPDPDLDPVFGPCERLDFELELGCWIGAGSQLGTPVAIADATEHLAGFCLLNDWSARDVQRWEMAPLGPFLAKSFATSVSSWVITPDALAPFRIAAAPRAPDDPRPLPYLHDADDQARGGLAVQLSVTLRSAAMRARGEPPATVVRSDARHLYWTPAQMVAHHTANGCNLLSGDLIGTGTISGPADDELGSLLERTDDGRRPLALPADEQRGYLQDGDEVTLTGRCVREGFATIGFGDCVGTVVGAVAPAPEGSR